MLKLNQNEKIIFVFSDPGGAKPILSFADKLNNSDTMVISDRYYSFYDDFNVKVKVVESGYADYESIVKHFAPDIIYTATSYKSNIEKEFLRIARLYKVKSCSFVDHWTSIIERFQYNNETNLPNILQVIDNRAKLLAIDQGIPEEIIEITGNPYHDKIKNWKPSISKNDFFKAIGLPNEASKIIVYAPDPLSNVDGFGTFGFDELIVTQRLVNLFQNNTILDWKIILKLHPNQNIQSIQEITKGNNSFIVVPDDISSNTSIYYADVVMGFFSSFLIEANVFEKPIIRYLPFGIKQDPIKELNLGTIMDDKGLIDFLIKQ